MANRILASVALVIALAACAGGGGGSSSGGPLVPLQTREGVAFRSLSGKPLSQEQARDAILAAARKRSWTVKEVSPSKLILTQSRASAQRSFSADVEVEYSAQTYSLRYAGSYGLQYSMQGGQSVIHSTYNRWVGTLETDIQAEMTRF